MKEKGFAVKGRKADVLAELEYQVMKHGGMKVGTYLTKLKKEKTQNDRQTKRSIDRSVVGND